MRALLASLVVLGLACGQLENDPLRRGTLRGALTEADSHRLVSVFGQPELRGTFAADGRSFELRDVPAGAAELFIVATNNKAARLQVVVRGAQVTDLAPVEPRAAGFADIVAAPPSNQHVSGR